MSNAFDDTQIDATFEINNEPQLDAMFEIYAAGTTWGSIDGNLGNQTDLKDALESKADVTTVEAISETVSTNTTEIATINATLTTYGDIVTHNVDEFATAAQGELADTALQPNDNITELTNNAGYITSAAVSNKKITLQKNGSTIGDFTLNQTSDKTINITVPTATSDLINDSGYITNIDSTDVTTALGYTPQPELTAGANIQINGNTISATDTTYSAGNGISINNNTISVTTTIASKTDIGNANLLIYGNSTPLGTFSANATSAVTVTVPIPTTATEVGALPSDTTIEDLTSAAQQAALNSGATSSNISAIATNTSHINEIYGLIPNDASTANQLTTEAFVNSSISTNTANFIGTFNSVAELEAYSGTLTNNDYAFVATEDAAGNTLYDRYKWNGSEWLFEYELNNSSFTADQWAAINSGITAGYVTQIAANTSAIAGKQDTLTAGNGINISGGTISTDTTIASKTDIGNATITITQGGVSKGTFTANATSNITIDVDATSASVNIDELTITKNGDDEIQTVAVIDNNSGNALKTWTGTSAQYQSIVTAGTTDSNTLYNVTDDAGTTYFADKNFSNITNTAKIAIAHNAAPSDTFENLTLGASGTEYIAPADGYVHLGKKATTGGQSIGMYPRDVNNVELGGIKAISYTNDYMYIFLPVRKGQKYRVYYSADGALDWFRFFYAVGSESEAS